MNPSELAKAVMAASQEADFWPPADEKALVGIELRFGIKLPVDMAEFYRLMNGMPWPTKPENGWIRVWALDSWRRVADEQALQDSKYRELADAVIIADHCDESWYYAAAFSQAEAQVSIYLVDGLRSPKLVTISFTAFLNAALVDSAAIYPTEPDTI